MLGNLENPTLDLDASDNGSLDVITATRSGIATFTSADGQIVTADPNTVRVDWSLGYPAMLIEPSATNLLDYSEDFSNAAWSKFGGGTGVAPTVTPDFGTSPDGTVSASRIQFNKGSGTGYTNMSIVFDSVQTSSGATTSKSVYLKSNTTEAYEMVIYETSDASGTNVKKITVTPDWQRFDVYGAVSSTTTGISIGLREINVSGLSNTADVLVWGAQIEEGSVATSYIPTSGSAVTRQADDLVIDGSDFTDFYNGSEGTFYMEIQPKNIQENIGFVSGQNSDSIFLYSNLNSLYLANYDGVNYLGLTPVDSSQLNRMATTYSASEKRISLNGSETSGAYNGNFATANMIYIGRGYWSYSYILGHIKRLIYWPTHSSNL
jgi:hypothetical protein